MFEKAKDYYPNKNTLSPLKKDSAEKIYEILNNKNINWSTEKNIINSLNKEQKKYIELGLSAISSYHVNGEGLPDNRTSEFTVKFLKQIFPDNNFNNGKFKPNGYLQHTKYIKKHIEIYLETVNLWKNIESENTTLKNIPGSIIKSQEIVGNIGKKLLNKDFRTKTVVHEKGYNLSPKKRQRADDKELNENASFIFPPDNKINNIFELLDKELNSEKDDYSKAANIGIYTFLSHPFMDGNSRTSRIAMVSYLESKGNDSIKLYTFATNFIKGIDGYDDFLRKEIYPLLSEIKEDIEFNDRGEIIKYPDLEKYKIILKKASYSMRDRLIKVNYFIEKNRVYIDKTISIISYLNTSKGSEKLILTKVVEKLLSSLSESGIEDVFTKKEIFDNLFEFTNSEKKKNQLVDSDIESIKNKLNKVLF